MTRVRPAIVAAILLLVGTAPTTLAEDDPLSDPQQLHVSTGGTVVLAPGTPVNLAVFVDSTVRVTADVPAIVAVDSTVMVEEGAVVSEILAIDSTILVADGGAVTGSVRTLRATVDTAGSGSITGEIAELDVASAISNVERLTSLVSVGALLAALAGSLLAAALWPRRVRSAGSHLGRQPVRSLVAGVLTAVGLVLVGAIAIATVVGVAFGIMILLAVLPLLAFAGFAVVATWTGERLLQRLRPNAPERRRPILATAIGVLVLVVFAYVPLAAPILSLAGLGAVVLSAVDGVRREATPITTAVAAGGS